MLPDYKPVQHVTVLNTVGNCNTVVFEYRNISTHRKGKIKHSMKDEKKYFCIGVSAKA